MNKQFITSLALTLPLLFSASVSASTLTTAITLDGKDWAQLKDTFNIAPIEIYNACGLQGRTCNGVLSNGVDTAGWKWATRDQSIALTNTVLGANFNGVDRIYIDTDVWFESFDFTGGQGVYDWTLGYSSDNYTVINSRLFWTGLGAIEVSNYNQDPEDFPQQDFIGAFHDDLAGDPYFQPIEGSGFYLYKNVPAVPVPAAAFMFAPALLGFMGLRRRAKSKAV